MKVIQKFNSLLGASNAEFIRHAKNYIVGEFFLKALSLISIPIVTRLLLPAEYGLMSIFVSIVTFFGGILILNFQGSVNRYYFEKDNDFSGFMGSILSFLGVFNLFALVFFWLFRGIFAKMFSITPGLFYWGIVVSVLMVPATLYLVYLQVKKESNKYLLLSMIKGVSILVISLALMWFMDSEKYLGKVYSDIVVYVIIDIYILYQLAKISRLSFNLSHIKYALHYGIPLLPASLSGYILTFFDRVIINQLTNATTTGLYSFAYNIGLLMSVVIQATNKAWVPIFFEKLTKKDYKGITDLASNYVKGIIICALGLVMFSRELVLIFADPSYTPAIAIVPVIFIGYLFNYLYMFYTNFIHFEKKTGRISTNVFVAALVNVALNYLLIPLYGYEMAAYTTVFAYIVLFMMGYFNAKALCEWTIPLRKLLTPFIYCAVATCVVILLNAYVSNYLLLLFLKICVLLAVSYIFFAHRIVMRRFR